MTETFYRTGNYNTDPTRFGGIIYESDFCTNFNSKAEFKGHQYTKGSKIANRIVEDWVFDMKCKRNIENNKSRNKKEEKGEN